MSVLNSSIGIEPLRLREACERARPAMLLLKESALLPINVNQLGSVSTVRGALPGLLGPIGTRTQRPALAAEAAVYRQRAYTLFMRAYNQVRRAVTFLREDDGDIERFAPSLYPRRRKPVSAHADEQPTNRPLTARRMHPMHPRG